ncbi:MAG: hydroxymethylbilane synthase [Bacillota bacterium]
MRTIRVGSRDSALAIVQTQWVTAELGRDGRQLFEILSMKTLGDQVLNVSLDKVGGKGLFVKELESALLDGSVDMAVHSLKDVPTELPDGLIIGAVTRREDPRDALVTPVGRPALESLDDLPQGARVGTSSLRRVAQIKKYRPDLEVLPVRGNVGTRLRKLDEGQFDALVMAAAGLTRLGLKERISTVLPTSISLPAVGQGALGIEVRAQDAALLEAIRPLHDPDTFAATQAERALLRRLEGGCHVPIGALGSLEEDPDGRLLVLEAMVAEPNGTLLIRGSRRGRPEEAEAMGISLAEELLERGGADILARLDDSGRHGWDAPDRPAIQS